MILPWLPLLAAGAAFFDFCVDEAGVAEGVGFVAGGGLHLQRKTPMQPPGWLLYTRFSQVLAQI